ncbi:hypothetical protein QQZ08_011869 [Neonectria magnoliae]|uniref:Uncharacterized protein n=1 Tax=Neonectria magnoliae TaxID=2732573 RepID=A0ABR1H6S6_9HYPO
MGSFQNRMSANGGCWFHHGTTGNINNSPLQWNIIGAIVAEEWQDCDCHLKGTCMDGEPPLPPMREFMMDDRLNPGWEARPWIPVPVKSPGHTYRPPGWKPGGPFVSGGPFGSEGANPFNKRDIGLPRASPWTLPSHVVRAFDALPKDKQNAILSKWPVFEHFANTLSPNLAGKSVELDPRPSLAILLADPRAQAGIVINAMSDKYANLVLRCADYAITELLDKTMQETIARSPSNKGHAATDNKDSKDITLKRSQYYEVFKHYAVLWEDHTPMGLNRQPSTDDDSFPFRGLNGLEAMKPEAVCKNVTGEAMAKFGTPGSFVAEFDKIMASLNDQIVEDNDDNSFLKSMHLPGTFRTTTEHLDWNPETLALVFDTSLPAVQVGLSYFALSLWVGNWPQLG